MPGMHLAVAVLALAELLGHPVAVAFFVAGADEDCADDADAHAADAAHVDAPGCRRVGSCRGRVSASGSLCQIHVRQRVSPAFAADDRHLLEAGAGFDAIRRFHCWRGTRSQAPSLTHQVRSVSIFLP